MQRGAKKRLILGVLLLLLLVIAVWVYTANNAFYRINTLVGIDYAPITSPATVPNLVYTFSEPLKAKTANGAAVLKSFIVGADSPTPSTSAAPFINLLISGAPFTPTYSASAPNILTTNTLPSGIAEYTAPLTITGAGTIWFAR